MENINFYAADTANTSIIAYGDINSKRAFKITYYNQKYFSWVLKNGAYTPIGNSKTLQGAKIICKNSIN